MGIFAARARRWGGSLGVVLPRGLVEEAGIEDGSELEISVRRRDILGKDLVGCLRDELRAMNLDWDEVRKELKAGWQE